MDDLQTRLREKLHSKLDGGSLLSPLTVAMGQEVWKELQPHVDVVRSRARTRGEHLASHGPGSAAAAAAAAASAASRASRSFSS